jgi:hypothetical protein
MSWRLAHPNRSIEFIHQHQQPDGAFVSHGGKGDPKSDLSVLYITVQANRKSCGAQSRKPRIGRSGATTRTAVLATILAGTPTWMLSTSNSAR